MWHDKTAVILGETDLNRKVNGKMSAVQIGSADVVLQETGGGMNTLHAGIAVRVSFQKHCCWDFLLHI